MLGAIFSFTAMAVAGRSLWGQHDTFEIMAYRSLLGAVIVVAVAWYAGTLGQVRRQRLGLHALRNLMHFGGQNLWFFAVGSATVPLATVFALEFTTPIWATLLAAVFLSERLTPMRLLAAGLGFLGVLVVAQPHSGVTLDPGLIAAALAAIGFGATAVATRALTRTETLTCVLFYLTVMQAVFGLVAVIVDGQVALPTLHSAPWLILVAICGLVAHGCMTMALSLAPPAVVTPIDFARLPLIAGIGAVFYSEPVSWLVFLGAAVIILANGLNLRTEARHSRS